MKKFLTLAAALLICLYSFAETKDKENSKENSKNSEYRGHFGIIGGMTSSSTSITGAWNDLKTANLADFHAGIAWKQPLILGFTLQPALIYNNKGSIIKADSGAQVTCKTSFIELPVQVQWAPFGNILNVLRPYIVAEPFLGYAINNNLYFGNETLQGWDYVKSRFEFGAALGLGIDVTRFVQVSVRYSWNFGNLYELNWPQVATLLATQCSGITGTVGIFF